MKVELLPQALLDRFAEVGPQTEAEDVKDIKVIAHYFSPYIGWDWYAVAYYPEDGVFYGYVKGDFKERGTFSLEELQLVKHGLPMVERDLYWTECSAKDIL